MVVGALDEQTGGRDGRAVHEIDAAVAVGLDPLAVVGRGVGHGRTQDEVLAAIIGAGRRDVGGREAHDRDDRDRVGAGGEADREVHVPAAVGAPGLVAGGEGVGLAEVDRMLEAGVEIRARGIEVEPPQIDARGHAADAAHGTVAPHVHADARLAVAGRLGRPHGRVRAEGQLPGLVVRHPRGRRGHQRRVARVDVSRGDRERDHVHDVDPGFVDPGGVDGDGDALGRRRGAARGLGDDRTVDRVQMDVKIEVVGGDQPVDSERDHLAGVIPAGEREGVGVAGHSFIAGGFVQICPGDRRPGPRHGRAGPAQGSRRGRGRGRDRGDHETEEP